MKLGIVGAGAIVNDFLPNIKKLEGLEVLGIQDVTLEGANNLCSKFDISCATTDFDELCATGIDTVYVAVPNFLHFDYCKKALEKGLNVIVEKPMASSEAESVYLADLAKSKKVFLFEAITTLYLGNYLKIQEWLTKIGEIKLVQSQYSQYSSRYDSFRSGQVQPAFDPNKSGGALMDLNLYNLHFVMGIFGSPDTVKYYANVERGIDTSGVLSMEYPKFVATCIAAKDSKGMLGSIIQGTDGYIQTSYSPNVLGSVVLHLNDGTKEEYDDGMAYTRLIPEFTAFIKAINEKDYDFCYRMLDKSIAVSRVQTEARLGAGVRFPADDRVF